YNKTTTNELICWQVPAKHGSKCRFFPLAIRLPVCDKVSDSVLHRLQFHSQQLMVIDVIWGAIWHNDSSQSMSNNEACPEPALFTDFSRFDFVFPAFFFLCNPCFS